MSEKVITELIKQPQKKQNARTSTKKRNNNPPHPGIMTLLIINLLVLIVVLAVVITMAINTPMASISPPRQLSIYHGLDVNTWINKNTNRIDEIYELYTQICKNREIAIKLIQTCLVKKVPLNFVMALVRQESEFNPNARNINENKSVDYGLFQLNSETYKRYLDAGGVRLLLDIDTNISLGIDHLLEAYKESKDWYTALSIYNRGSIFKSPNGYYISNIIRYEQQYDDMFSLFVCQGDN